MQLKSGFVFEQLMFKSTYHLKILTKSKSESSPVYTLSLVNCSPVNGDHSSYSSRGGRRHPGHRHFLH